MHHACLILQLMQVCMTILPMWFLGLHVLIYMFVYTWVMRVWIYMFLDMYIHETMIHILIEYVWMWFSSPWCLVYWFAYLHLCDCYFMSPRVLIDWWLQDAILEFTCLFGSYVYFIVFDCYLFDMLCLYHFPLDIYIFFDKHFPPDINMGSHVIFIDGIVDSSFHNKRLHVCTFFKEREKKFSKKYFKNVFKRGIDPKSHLKFSKGVCTETILEYFHSKTHEISKSLSLNK